MSMDQSQKESLIRLFQADARILSVYLFGSRARGEATAESDFDLAFLTKGPLTLEEQADLNTKVMMLLGNDRVDFTFLTEAPILLRYEILSDGKLLYSSLAQEAVNAFELSTYREYFHTERFRRLQSESLREAFSKE